MIAIGNGVVNEIREAFVFLDSHGGTDLRAHKQMKKTTSDRHKRERDWPRCFSGRVET